MRKIVSLLLACLLLAGLSPAALAANVTASVSTETITLNGVEIDNQWLKYPLLVYRDITYFPMTYHLCSFLGVSTSWDGTALSIDRTGGGAKYYAETSKTRQKGRVSAEKVEYPVVINGNAFDSKNAQWPLLNYSNITYFPLTWALAAEELGWDYKWDAANGLQIDSGNPNGVDTSLSQTDGEMINAITRGFAPSVMAVQPENLTVDLWGDWTISGIQEAIRKGLADYVTEKGYQFAKGGPSDIQISYWFQFPAQMWSGMELKVPFTAVFLGNTVTLPSGNPYTPSANTQELTATVRLSGQGSPAEDSAFQAGQAMYQQLKKCTETGTISVTANSVFNVMDLLQTAVTNKLYAAGLSGQYIVQSLSLGQHVTVLDAGSSMTVDFEVIFAPLKDSAPTDSISISSQAVFQAK